VPGLDDSLRERAAKWAEETAIAQELPARIEDIEVLRDICELLGLRESDPGSRTVDSGMNTIAATVATEVSTSKIQKSQWYERYFRIGPASTIPSPPPIPRRPDTSPIAPATRSRGS
jgi:hypothetical protein